jgi:hypothetical protein
MFNRKKDAKKFAENLAAPRQLRSSAPSPLFQLGHKKTAGALGPVKTHS